MVQSSWCGGRFGDVFCSTFELDLADGFGMLIIRGGGVETGEDVIKVNRFTLDEMRLTHSELGKAGHHGVY